jgi:hypothetical protein
MGCIGGVFVLGLFAWRLWPRAGSRKREQLFWLLFVVCCICLGVATQGERDHYGVAHITLQSLTLLGITFLAANLTHLPRWLRWVPIFGLAIDFALGILLLVRMENSLDKWAIGGNLDLKHANNWNLRFLGDLVPPAAVPLQVLIVALVVVMLWLALRRSGIVPPLFRRRAEAQPEPAPH